MANPRSIQALKIVLSLVFASLFFSATGQVYEWASPVCTGPLFTPGATYAQNIFTLVTNLSTYVGADGFSTNTSGEIPDTVNGAVMCRGDIQLQACRACILDATDLIESCNASTRQVTIWGDICMLRYSNQLLFGRLDTDTSATTSREGNVTDPDRFRTDLMSLVSDLQSQASNGSSSRKVAAGSRSTIDLQTIYALVQCTPNLAPRDCANCIRTAATILPIAIGARSFMPSCNIQYELTRFYNETRLQELAVPSPPDQTAARPERNSQQGANPNTTNMIIIIVVVFACAVIAVPVVYFVMRRRSERKKTRIEKEQREIEMEQKAAVEKVINKSVLPKFREYKLDEIKEATSHFSDANKLGQGGYGPVYKGKLLPDGPEIAAKRLSTGSGQGNVEFKNEVEVLARLSHKNLVKLLGFSMEGEEKLLVYEFVPNGSLHQFLFGRRRPQSDWTTRYRIIDGIARGIQYLHEGSNEKIIHRDIKPDNVLLDTYNNPKIADFGLAKLFEQNNTHRSTSRVIGTPGYMPPEYEMQGQYSVKTDVFSFGVLLLEIISCKQFKRFVNGETEQNLMSLAWENWRNGTPSEFVDRTLGFGSSVPDEIIKCIRIGLLCVQQNAAARPIMELVVSMLSGVKTSLPEPSVPAFVNGITRYLSFEDTPTEDDSSNLI